MRFKRAISLLLIVCIVFAFNPSLFASRGAYDRNGFRLVPVDSDSTGIAVDSEFLLETEKDFTLEEVIEAFSIDGEPDPVIEELDPNFFSIRLSRPLLENTLYTFRMSTDIETTWIFQTQTEFKILGSLPGNESVGVPVNTGIEVYFSHSNFSNIEDYFEITPYVRGRFEVHDKTAVFVPNGLKEETVYTVRIKKGIKIEGTERTIKDDYVFSFETKAKGTPDTTEPTIYINYNRQITDFLPEDKPLLPFSYYIGNAGASYKEVSLYTGVYAYKDFESFYEAVCIKNNIPQWAQVSYSNNYLPVDGLEKVLEFKQILNERERMSGSLKIEIPQNLPEGYYIVESLCEGKRAQTFIQVTNIGTYITKSDTKTLVWLNDLNSGEPLGGAAISFSDVNDTFYTDKKGISTFKTELINYDNNETYSWKTQLMSVKTADGRKSLLDTTSYVYNYDYYYGSGYYYNYNSSNNKYWRYFFTDRDMYKPDDTINVWGFVKNRYEDEEIDYLSLEIYQSWYYQSSGIPLVKENISVKDNFFEGQVELPNLPKNYYTLLLKKGNTVISSTVIRVEDYVKPSYKMQIEKDKQAVFIGDKVNFKLNAAFFEGTGVSNLNVNYTLGTGTLTGSSITENAVTDTTGNLDIEYIPEVTNASLQGITSVGIDARALLPESGEITAYNRVRLFINDIDVSLKGEINNGKGTINAKVHEIVLDRLNNGTAQNINDYLGDPVNSKRIVGTIYKNTWLKEESGTYYDYINKVTRKKYRYWVETTAIDSISMTTSSNGEASYTFDAPKTKDTYYTADLSCIDNSGRSMKFKIYIGEKVYYSGSQNVGFALNSDKDSYRIGEDVKLDFTFSNENLPDGDYIYILSQNGIRSYDTSDKSSYTFEFKDEYMPNIQAAAVYFSGKGYVSSSKSIKYDMSEKNLIIKAETDKSSYKPGEKVTLKVYVTDIDGNPVKACVNASIVDEAFFSLDEQYVNVLERLFDNVSSGVFFEAVSHDIEENIYRGMTEKADGGGPVPSNGGGSDPNIRSDFKDTAQFASIETDSSGKGEMSFKLPDNVTSWRITMSAISKEFYAGSDKVNMIVTLPFFINYSFNSSYMEGDRPVMAVNAYGAGLKEEDVVYFEVYDKRNPEKKVTVKGKAFDRVNIPLWTLEGGYYDLIIRAYTETGLSDAIQHSINVVDSYYQIERADFFDVVPGMSIKGGESGNTRIVIQDRSKGMYLSELMSLYYRSGNRIDQFISKYLASNLLNEYFKDNTFVNVLDKPDLSQYQKTDGGLSLLPYSESDIDISAKLSVLVKDMVNAQKLISYFEKMTDDNATRIKALYGLAVLDQPVLLMLDEAEKIDNTSLLDNIYLALAYCELGDLIKAEEIYEERISPYIEEYAPYYRVNTGSGKDSILEATSLCAYLASKLDRPEKEGLYDYCRINFTKDLLIYTEKIMYISEVIDKSDNTDSQFTYSYDGKEETIELKNGRSYSINLLPYQLQNFKITDVKGKVAGVAIYEENVFDIKKVDDQISIKRSYHYANGTPLNTNTLKHGDIIKVRLEWSISPDAFDGSYEITDYLPSGLKPYRSAWNSDGQKITFYVYSSSYWRTNPYIEYYARVISPGVYTAQGTVIQSLTSRNIINTAKTVTVTVETDEVISEPIDPPVIEPTPEPVLYGDLNEDLEVNSTDFTILKRVVLRRIDASTVSIKAADLNGDGSVDSTDVTLLRRFLLRKIDKFPVEKQ
jgi:hypothetical protein